MTDHWNSPVEPCVIHGFNKQFNNFINKLDKSRLSGWYNDRNKSTLKNL